MVELSRLTNGEIVADLGSGDGRISIAFAKAGGRATGFEIDIELVHRSEQIIKAASLQDVIKINNQNFWEEDLSSFDIVVVYPMPDIMEQLERKLTTELKKGARVLTNYYVFPSWKQKEMKDNIYLFER